VRQVAQQRTLAFLPQFPVGDIAHALKRKLTAAERLDLHHCLDCQNSPILCAMQKLAGPNPFLMQLVRDLFE
jgi:hypothetical protein